MTSRRNWPIRSITRVWYHQLTWYNSLWLWRWLPHRLSKRQSLSTTVLFRTDSAVNVLSTHKSLKEDCIFHVQYWRWDRHFYVFIRGTLTSNYLHSKGSSFSLICFETFEYSSDLPGKVNPTHDLPARQTRGPFLESPDNFSGPKISFMFVLFAFKIKVSIILKMT